MRLPNNRFSFVMMLLLFLSGVAMIIIPMISHHQEIEEDNNIYALLAQEIQAQAVSDPEETPPEEPSQDESPQETEIPQAESPDEETVPEAEAPQQSPDPEFFMVAPVQPAEATQEPEPEEESGIPLVQPTSEPESSKKPTALPTASPKPEAPKQTAEPRDPASENKDYVGWITLPGTPINYPVVRSNRTDYYLHHLFNGQKSKLGCLFSLNTADYETPSKNIAIYGHHLSNSTAMFSTLMNYKSKDYWLTHQTIRLNTIYGNRTYKIFAVLNHTVSDWDASTASFKSDESFLNFVNRAKRKAFYDTGIEVSESDHIITLITCDRSFGGVQGRLLVMGVEQ